MDLKSYAVFRKLTQNSDLLKYVVKNQPVPIDVLKRDMHDLLDNLHDANAEQVVTNYQKYLEEHVRMNFIPDGKDQFDVNGEIEEPLIESIEMLHNVDRKQVVNDLVNNMMATIRGERDVNVDQIELTASADAFVAETRKPLFVPNVESTKSSTVEQPSVDSDATISPQRNNETQETANVETSATEFPDLDFLTENLPETNIKPERPLFEDPDDEPTETPSEQSESVPEAEPVDEDAPSNQEPIDTQEMPPDESPIDPVDDMESDAIPNDVSTDDVSNEPNSADNTHSKTITQQDSPFKKAYDFLVNEIKDRQIDTRLPGLHLPQ